MGAIVGAIATVGTAALSFYLNERAKRKAEWQQKKFTHYSELFSAVSDLAVDSVSHYEANEKFAKSSNTITLIASQEVISHLMVFHDFIKFSNKDNFTTERHDALLKDLILAIRKDIGLSEDKDNPETFNYHLVGSRPKDNRQQRRR